MSDNVIQQQISLLDFKAVKTSFELVEEDEDNITEPEFNFNLNNILFSADPKLFAKSFVVNLTVILENTNHILKLNVEFHTIFRCLVDIDDSFLESDFVKISAPAIGFPGRRSCLRCAPWRWPVCSVFAHQQAVVPLIGGTAREPPSIVLREAAGCRYCCAPVPHRHRVARRFRGIRSPSAHSRCVLPTQRRREADAGPWASG